MRYPVLSGSKVKRENLFVLTLFLVKTVFPKPSLPEATGLLCLGMQILQSITARQIHLKILCKILYMYTLQNSAAACRVNLKYILL